MEPSPGLNMEQVFQIIGKMSEDNQKNLILAIQEMKRPSLEEQERLDKDKERARRRAVASAELAKAEEEGRMNRQRTCPHGTTHPGTKAFTHQWRAQVHTPRNEKPYFRPTCTQCGTQMPKIYATTDQIQNGVNLDQYNLDIDSLTAWAKQSEALVA